MAKKTFKPGTMLNPLPVVMVTCGQGDEKNIITIAWTGIVNSEPPMTYVSVRESRHSYDLIKKSGEFVINTTTEELAKATDYCGVKSGRDVDKFKEMGLTPIPAQMVSCPMIKESPVNLECKVKDIHAYGSHHMFVAEIVNVHVDEELIDEAGRIHIDKSNPLAYVHGEYFGIKKYPIGKFGYSIMKAKTRKRINKETNNRYRGNKKRG